MFLSFCLFELTRCFILIFISLLLIIYDALEYSVSWRAHFRVLSDKYTEFKVRSWAHKVVDVRSSPNSFLINHIFHFFRREFIHFSVIAVVDF